MSAELQPLLDSEKKTKKKDKKDKKHKKHRDDDDEPTIIVETTPKKKRRREEEEGQVIDDVETTAAVAQDSNSIKSKKKKHKNNKHEVDEVIPDSQPDVRPAKKHKKDKKDHHDHHKHHRHPHAVAEINTPGAPPAAESTTSHNENLLRANSPFVQQTTSLYLPLSPCAFNSPLEGACAEHISPLLLTYSSILKGVVLAYSNPRLSESPDEGAIIGSTKLSKTKKKKDKSKRKEMEKESSDSEEKKSAENIVLAQSVDEYGVAYIWVTADFLLFRPRRGTYLEGYVNLQNESMLGLMCYNYFNAGIEREKLPLDWRWVDGRGNEESRTNQEKSDLQQKSGGYFVDGSGRKVDGRLVFHVEDFEAVAETEAGGGTISIIGSLLPPTEPGT